MRRKIYLKNLLLITLLMTGIISATLAQDNSKYSGKKLPSRKSTLMKGNKEGDFIKSEAASRVITNERKFKKNPSGFSKFSVPTNDECSTAEMLTVGTVCTGVQGDVSGANQSEPPVTCNGYLSPAAFDVWYQFVATATDQTILVTESPSFDAVIVLQDACSGTMLECADNTFGGGSSETINVIGLTVGNTYVLRVYHWGNTYPATTTFNICVFETPPPPANDECSSALLITPAANEAACSPLTVNTLGATQTAPIASCAPSSSDDDIWYYFVATDTSMSVKATNLGTGITGVGFGLFDSSCAGTEAAECEFNAPGQAITFNKLVPGNTYYLVTFTTGTTVEGTYDICVFPGLPTPPPPPANDECSAATLLTVSPTCSAITADAAGATESLVPNVCDGYTSPTAMDVWFSFVASSANQTIFVDESAAFDAVVELFDACNGTVLACSDKTFGGGNSETLVATGLTIGNTYSIRVFNWGSTAASTTTFDICVYDTPPPPANDECSGAISITPALNDAACSYTTVTTTNATQSTPTPVCAPSSSDDDVWYSFVANDSVMTVKAINLGTGITGVGYALYDSCGGTESPECEFDAPSQRISFHNLVSGNTYYLKTFSTGTTAQGTYDICVYAGAPVILNDNCSGATSLPVNLNCVHTQGDISGANESAPAILCAGYTSPTSYDVWYSFVAPDPNVDITVGGSPSFDGVIELLDSCMGTSLACADQTLDGGTEVLNATGLTIGSTYIVRVYHWGSTYPATTSFTICATSTSVGVNNLSAGAGLSVFPNPAHNDLSIRMNTVKVNTVSIKMVNTAGQEVYTHSTSQVSGEFNHKINLQGIAKGIYMLQVTTDNSVTNRVITIN